MNKPLVSKQKQAVQAVRIDREIFGKLLVIEQSYEILIQELMRYELASIPLTLFCLNGSLRKKVKCPALKWLEPDTADPYLPKHFQGRTKRGTDCRTFSDLSGKRFRKV